MKWGNSLAIRIPRSVAAETKLEYGSTVDLQVESGAMVVRPQPEPTLRLTDLLKKVSKRNVQAEVTTGRRRGREVW